MPALRTTELPGRDRGTSIITGVSDAQFELLKWFFVEVDDDTGYDAAAEVIARTMASISPGMPAAGAVPVPAIEPRDLLDDAGVCTTNTGNVPRLDPADLRRVLAKWG